MSGRRRTAHDDRRGYVGWRTLANAGWPPDLGWRARWWPWNAEGERWQSAEEVQRRAREADRDVRGWLPVALVIGLSMPLWLPLLVLYFIVKAIHGFQLGWAGR